MYSIYYISNLVYNSVVYAVAWAMALQILGYKLDQISNIDNLVVYHHFRYYRCHIRIFKVENIANASVEVKITITSASTNTRTKD